MARTALVTGLTGQDGGYLAEQLTAEGTVVHGLVRPGEDVPAHIAELGDAVVVHEGELSDADRLAEVIRTVSPDEVYNLAGVSSVALSWQEPVLTAQVNGLAVAELLEQLMQHRDRTGRDIRVVQASSAEVFAGTTTSPQSESTPLSPTSPYGASKAYAHHLVQVYRGRGLHAVNAILYNHESPRRPATFVTRKITSTVAAIARGQATELVLGNVDARRDWGWAPQYVEAMTRMARHPVPGDYVVATGEAHSVEQFVEQAFLHVGIQDWRRLVRCDAGFTRPVDATELVGNTARAHHVLGWRATVTFPELVARMVDADLS